MDAQLQVQPLLPGARLPPLPTFLPVTGESKKGAPGRKPLTAASVALDRMRVRDG